MHQDDDDLLRPVEAARMLGDIHPVTLAAWRHQGRGPRYIKLGDRPRSPVRYRRGDVRQYLKDREAQ